MTVYVAFGDSIIGLGQIPATVASLTGMTTTNVGIAGTGLGTSGGSVNHDRIAGYALADAVISNQWSVPVAAAAVLTADGQCPGATDAVASLRAIDLSAVDIATISYGTNDFGRSRPIGTNADTTPATFKGAINYTLKKLMTAFPLMRIMLTTPIWRGFWAGQNQNSDATPNSIGLYLSDYADAILEIGKRFHVPTADLYRNSGINEYNQSALLQSDRIHPNAAGDRQMAFAFASALLSHFPMPYADQANGIGSIFPTPLNGWATYTAGYAAQAILQNGVVQLVGILRPGSKRLGGTVLFNLPAGYRPPFNRLFIVAATHAGSTIEIQVLSSGAVRLGGGFRGDFIALDGIKFRAA